LQAIKRACSCQALPVSERRSDNVTFFAVCCRGHHGGLSAQSGVEACLQAMTLGSVFTLLLASPGRPLTVLRERGHADHVLTATAAV
jgi:hypothetical protein